MPEEAEVEDLLNIQHTLSQSLLMLLPSVPAVVVQVHQQTGQQLEKEVIQFGHIQLHLLL